MGSLRNPIGPLPSSIYWRRRAVLLSVIAVLALLVVWIVTSGGDEDDGGGGADGKGPTSSITPGPTDSRPPISEAPGGREESGGGDTNGGADGGSTGAGSGDGGTGGGGSGSGGADTGGAGNAGGTGGGSGSGGAGTGGSGARVPAGSPLPDCTPGAVKLVLRSAENTYKPGEKPKLELVASNSSGTACKLDLGPEKAVVEITRADTDDLLWSSADCPRDGGSLLLRISAKTSVTHTVVWDRSTSEPNCASPRPGSAALGETYLVEVKAPGLPEAKTSFVLAKD